MPRMTKFSATRLGTSYARYPAHVVNSQMRGYSRDRNLVAQPRIIGRAAGNDANIGAAALVAAAGVCQVSQATRAGARSTAFRRKVGGQMRWH